MEITVPGTAPAEDPDTPDTPVTPDTPASPSENGPCKWCGETHNQKTLSGWLTAYLHAILTVLFKLTQFITLQW